MDAGLEDLKALRDEVTRLTLEIIRLSGERVSLAKRIGEIKAQNNLPIEDPLVENELRVKVVDLSQKCGVDINFALKLLDLLLEESKRVQRDIIKSRFYKM
ncbi:MAG: chorismate mutase [Candidatus Bathyarchaeia archaeon]